MRIAYISTTNPSDIHHWSGTSFHIFQALSAKHEVVWLGKDLLEAARCHHVFLRKKSTFYPEQYRYEMAAHLQEQITADKFDVIVSCCYYIIAALQTSIPILYISDLIFPLYKDFFQNQHKTYHKLILELEQQCLRKCTAITYPSRWTTWRRLYFGL